MIEGIDIENFGSFKNFRWDTVREPRGNNHAAFKYLNIIYGRNCSGKTTLSRIVRTLETGVLPPRFDAPSFTIQMAGNALTAPEVVGHQRDVRVYNRDFVDKHLSFLRRADGTIDTFAIFGAENRAIGEEIEAKTRELGSVDGKAGLLYERWLAAESFLQARSRAGAAEQLLEDQLIKKATNPPDGIKHRREFGDVNYNKVKLREDIAEVLRKGRPRLDPANARTLTSLVNESALPVIDVRVNLTSDFPAIAEAVADVLTRVISPSQAIRELLDDAALQEWVQHGIGLHRDKRTTCGFCQQALPADFWQMLDAHFNEAATELASQITTCQQHIQQEISALDSMYRVPLASVYAVHREELARLTEELDGAIHAYRATLTTLADALRQRAQRIFEPQEAPQATNGANLVRDRAAAINDIIAASNATTWTLGDHKTAAMRSLLLDEVTGFVAAIQYEDTVATNSALSTQAEELQRAERALGERVAQIQADIQALRERQQDERRAAARVSELLQRHFGDQGLHLMAVQTEDSAPFTFHIARGSNIAYNLSDGECSIVAFCYFLAKLEDAGTQGRRPILWIDDPISSLDSNHVFFLYSLIESLVAAPMKDANGASVYPYSQLFISTHNLEFLKYLRRLPLPRKTGDKEKDHRAHFLVAKRDGGSVIQCMPEYLVKYTTEFNFLFDELHTCVNVANQPQNLHAFFNFGHNLRRFLEAYLYFKLPFADGSPDQDFAKRIEMFFGDDAVIVSRLAHEGSHLMGAFDRAMRPAESDEISKVARLVLTTIRSADKAQYDALLASVGKSCPLDVLGN